MPLAAAPWRRAVCRARFPQLTSRCGCYFIVAVRNGHIKRITDADIQSSVLEIAGTNVSTTYVTCPADPKKTLGIKLPFLVMIIKNVSAFQCCPLVCVPGCVLTHGCGVSCVS